MKTTSLISLLLLICFFFCMYKKEVNDSEYIQWIEDENNGMLKSKQMGDFLLEAKYRPINYEKALLTSRGTPVTEEMTEDDFYYFTLKVSLENGSGDLTEWNAKDMTEVQRNIYYLSFLMQNDISLVDGNDTLKCVHYVYERSFDLGNFKIFNIGFDPVNWSTETKSLIINSKYFGTVPVKFKFKKSDFENLPNLKI